MCDTWVCLKTGVISQFMALSRLENEVFHQILGILRQTLKEIRIISDI